MFWFGVVYLERDVEGVAHKELMLKHFNCKTAVVCFVGNPSAILASVFISINYSF